MAKTINRRANNLLPHGVLPIVQKELGVSYQTAWNRVHLQKDPVALGIVNREIEKTNKERSLALKKFKQLVDNINN